MNKDPIRCQTCGKFISYDSIPHKVIIDYTPDTEHTVEKLTYKHKECSKSCQNQIKVVNL